jgi:hypothetical protein
LIQARVVILSFGERLGKLDAGREAVHLRLGIELSHCQIAGLGRAAGPDPHKLADRGQSAPQDGDGQDNLQQ